MSKEFLNKIGLQSDVEVRNSGDVVAATADQVADHLENALRRLEAGEIDAAKGNIRGAFSQLVFVVTTARRVATQEDKE